MNIFDIGVNIFDRKRKEKKMLIEEYVVIYFD